MKKLFLIAIGVLCVPINAYANANNTPVVVELFTSQSCSSCPPADKALEKLSKEPNVIALSCNVTYWNHLHWKDTLSKDFCTQRQRQYAAAFNNSRVYTPQTIVNGKHEMIGSHEGKIRRAIHLEKKNKAVSPIDLEITAKNELSIALPQIKEGNYILSILVFIDTHTQSIQRGENRGRTVRYTHPVETISNALDSWDGSKKTIKTSIDQWKDAQGIVVVAHENSATGAIIAAAQIKT